MSQLPVSEIDVLIVGAGPTGLVMAAEMARRGVSYRLVDIARSPTDLSKAIGIQARTLEIFDSLGIASEFTSRGVKGVAANIYDGRERIAHVSFAELDSRFPYLLFLPQSETERLLLAHLEHLGGQVERGVKLVGFTQDETGVTAALEHPNGDGESVRAAWLVGCDGAHSTVRHGLNLPFQGEEYPEGFQLADVKLDWDQPDNEFYIFIHAGWLLAVFPLPGGRSRLIADIPPEQAPVEAKPSLADCQALMNERCPFPATVSDPLWTANYRIHRRLVSRLRSGRAFLVGDAAHIHSPAGAQGMNTGIQDAFNLAWKLALATQGAAPESLLDSYHDERYPVEQDVLRGTDFLLRMASLRNPLARATRDKLAPLVTGLDIVQQRLSRTISELAVGYRRSPMVEDHGGSDGPHAGDRAPDPLFARLKDTRHTLRLLAGQSASPAEWDALTDIGGRVQAAYSFYVAVMPLETGENGEIAARYGVKSPCLYLIRPDGYIGFRSQVGDRERLFSYLARLFPGDGSSPQN